MLAKVSSTVSLSPSSRSGAQRIASASTDAARRLVLRVQEEGGRREAPLREQPGGRAVGLHRRIRRVERIDEPGVTLGDREGTAGGYLVLGLVVGDQFE